uniref:ribosomal protein L23 n=1 Tax=Schizaea fistulosa TaxID=292911 RepID=UPI00211513A1|nr:ribosomal protein L23 [Schizaea fistulosa]UTJ90266.1 ribosomal protein L23 [Schizaea fistulosa]
MNKLKNQVLTGKSISLLEKNQYTFDVNPESTKTEIKDWIEKSFAVRVRNINSHRLPVKKRKGKANFYTCHKRVIVTLQGNHSIPLFFNEQIS